MVVYNYMCVCSLGSTVVSTSNHIVADHDARDTVGAVALDASGNYAYATSTGGMSAKQLGRVGDSPIVGR